MKWKKPLLISVVVAGFLGGVYLLSRQILDDRKVAMAFQEKPLELPAFGKEERLPDGRTIRTYTSKDLEEAKKRGKGSGLDATRPDPFPTANDAAVQRSLRTIEEINRINEMNRRVAEQQQRNR